MQSHFGDDRGSPVLGGGNPLTSRGGNSRSWTGVSGGSVARESRPCQVVAGMEIFCLLEEKHDMALKFRDERKFTRFHLLILQTKKLRPRSSNTKSEPAFPNASIRTEIELTPAPAPRARPSGRWVRVDQQKRPLHTLWGEIKAPDWAATGQSLGVERWLSVSTSAQQLFS